MQQATNFSPPLTVAISSRALFNLDDSNRVFEQQGVDAYADYQINREEEILEPGVAFNLVNKLLALNQQQKLVEVILLSRNSADTSLRIRNSIQQHHLNIERAIFTSGESPYRYITAFGIDLFLSANAIDVKNALQAHCAAATIYTPPTENCNLDPHQLRIAFDGDAVLFSDEAERIYQQQGLSAFVDSEQTAAKQPLSAGPFKNFMAALHQLQQTVRSNQSCPIRTALVTARSFVAHERVVRTLRSWGVRIDEALFLGGLDKGKFLQAFGADIYFDDQHSHCQSTAQHVATGHVPHGVRNEEEDLTAVE